MHEILRPEKNPPAKQLFLLVDPDNYSQHLLEQNISYANQGGIDCILAGGSTVSHPIDALIQQIKKLTTIPVFIFPGSIMQISTLADGIFLLVLISGRNPEYLIGNHVIAAPLLKQSQLKIIPTGYILIENGRTTSVEYMSNTRPIPSDKPDIVKATAMAGEMMGQKAIYLESGSGAKNSVSIEIIKEVKNNISVPLIVGGGIRQPEELYHIYNAGADIVVMGNIAELQPESILEFCKIRNQFTSQ